MSETVHDIATRITSGNPRFVVRSGSGKGYAIVGAAQTSKDYLERQEAMIQQFMKDHPGLTRDEAMKALEGAGR